MSNKFPKSSEQNVVIAGGGWAGLAAAVELARAGMRPLLLESAITLGGRARTVPIDDLHFDNGQHILTGACHETLALMKTVGVDSESAMLRRPFEYYISGKGCSLTIRPRPLPLSLNIAWGLLHTRGVSWRGRWAAISFAKRLLKNEITFDDKTTIAQLLQREGQDERMIELLWGPLAISALNTPIDIASASLFVTILQRCFSQQKSDADLLIPTQPLGDLLPIPAKAYIESQGGEVITSCRLMGFQSSDDAILCEIYGQPTIKTQDLILATPPHTTTRLLANHSPLQPISDSLSKLHYLPITTLYLCYPERVTLPEPMVGMAGTTTQWLFDRGVMGQQGVITAVISGPGEHNELGRTELEDRVAIEVAKRYPKWPQPTRIHMIREQRATFSATEAGDSLRPTNKTPLNGCWLAGDYTNTGLPSTLEGAVTSGLQCARQLANQRNKKVL